MLKITLTLPPYTGEYELDSETPFTMRELHWIKEIADVRVGELEEAGEKGDSDLLVSFTAIAVYRAGKLRKEQVSQFVDLLLDAPDGALTVELTSEDDASPPVLETPQPSKSTSSENKPSSSEDSNSTGDDHQAIGLVSTGAPT